ncbi:MAG TPA: phosphatase PAP2 family protein [Bacteroidia bacterium]|jgi:membrane-associated phospholipid phosphatase|nr:phosphatase PAP2 family protein [Bacteroidia bacterium]
MNRLKIILFFLFSVNFSFSQSGEVKLLSSIYADSSKNKDAIAKGLSFSVAPLSFGVPAAILITGLIKKDSALIEKGIKASVSFALNAVVTTGMKYGFERSRPFSIYPNLFHAKSKAGDYSFPSGHTSFAFAAATSITLSFPKWYVAVPAYAWASCAAWSRMHLGVHYPTDVLMGAIVGTASSFLTFKLDKWLNKKKK